MEQLNIFIEEHILLVVILALWSIPWKGYALWQAARLSHIRWFVVLLITNTLAILDIIYIFFVARKSAKTEEEGEEV